MEILQLLYEKKVVVAFCLISFTLAYPMIEFENLATYGGISSLAVLVISLPCLIALYQEIGQQKTVRVLLVLGILTVVVEAVAVKTGLPYGKFSYSERMGYLLFDTVPPTIAFGYLPILLGSMAVAGKFKPEGRWRFTTLTAAINLLMDMVIDPAFVSNGFWAWENQGFYYGVPLVNFLGWALTGFTYANIYYQIVGGEIPLSPRITTSLLYILSLWTSYLLQKSLLFPRALGAVTLAILISEY